MRRIVDLTVILTILAVAGAWWMMRDQAGGSARVDEARDEVSRMRAQVLLRSQSDRNQLNAQGWPETIDPEWFGSVLPTNPLLDGNRPWLEIAAENQAGWQHPRPLFALDDDAAMFWYNPALGIVRARVPMSATDGDTLALYNDINASSLVSLDPSTFGDIESLELSTFDTGRDPEKQ